MADFEFTGVAGTDEAPPPSEGVALPQSSTAPVLSPTSQQTFGQALTYGLPSLGLGLIDTLGQSLHIIKNDTIPKALANFTGDGPGTMGDFYTRNQAELRAGGEIAGMFLPGLAAMKALKSVNGLREAGSVGSWAKNSTALNWLLGSSAELAATEGKIVQGTKDAIASQGIWAGRTISTPAVVAAKRGYYATQALNAARATTAFELGNFAAFNSSQLFYPADVSAWDQAKWVAGGYAVGLGLEFAASRYAIRQMVQSATRSDIPQILTGEPGRQPAYMSWALGGSPLAKDADKVMFRANERGVGLTAYAGMNADLNETLKVSNNPATLKTNVYQDQVNIKKVMTEQIGAMAYDTHQFIPRTKLDQSQIELGIKALDQNPTSFLYSTKLGQLPENGAKDFYETIGKEYDKAKSKFDAQFWSAGNLHDDPAKVAKLMADANKEFGPIEEAANEMHYVIEPTGEWTVYKNRAENWLDNNYFKNISRKKYIETDPADIENKLTRSKLMLKADNNIILHDDFRAELPASPTPLDFSGLYAAGSKMINEWRPVEGQTFIMTPKVNWRQLEMQVELAKKYPEAAQQVKLANPGFITPEEIRASDEAKFAAEAADSQGYATKQKQVYGAFKPEQLTRLDHWAADSNFSGIYNTLPEANRVKIFSDIADHFVDLASHNTTDSAGTALEDAVDLMKKGRDPSLELKRAQKLAKDQGTFFHFSDFVDKQSNLTKGLTKNPYADTPGMYEMLADLHNSKLGATGFSSLDDVEFHILNEKFKEFNKLMPDTEGVAIAKPGSLLNKLGSLGKNLTPQQVIARLNLPANQGFQQNPLLEMFAHAKLQGMKDLNEMFPAGKGADGFSSPYSQLDLVKQHLRETADVTDSAVQIPYQGKLLQQTSDTKPIFVAAKSTPHLSISDANIQARVQAMRDVQLQRLSQITPATSPLVAGVIQKIVSAGREGGDLSGAANSARAVQTMQDGVLSGTGQIVYQDRINEQHPTLKALQLVAQDTDKFVDDYVSTLSAGSLTPKYASMLATKNRNDLFDFNRIEHSYRHGWDIKGVVPAENGTGYSFLLDEESAVNQKLKALHFPDVEPEEITLMPDMSVTAKKQGMMPLQVSKAAGDLAVAISDMSKQSGVENNALRAALGKRPIALRDFHLPTPELNKEGTWFVRNPTGDVIATYTGANARENEQLAKEAAGTFGEGHTAIPLETVKRDHQINDDNFFSIINYSDQLMKTGTAIRGGLAQAKIDTSPNTLKAMVMSLQEQFLNVGIRSRAAIFEPELNYARQAADTATTATRDNSGGVNIFDRYTATMFSQAPKAAPQNARFLQKTYGAAEDGFDRTLSWLYQHYDDLTGSESTKAGAKVLRTLLRKRSSDEEFAQFQKTLPKWSPFEDTEAWRESTFRDKSPITSRQISTTLAKVSSTLSLRLLDVGTAINNLAGLVTNAPSVVYALRRAANESTDDWINRTAAWGTRYTDGSVTFSPMKAMNETFKSYWRGELNGPMEDAAKHGYFKPEYSALAKALATPVKPSIKALEDFTTIASKFADNSELFSRKIAWGMGYKIGKDLHKFDDEKNAYIFANNFVNDMIGNYSPNNKPAMFQGALGLPLGAFQTYMFNFYRRLYGNIERGDKAAIIAQYAAQASVFGARSVPGYSAWNTFFQSNNIGSDDFTGRVRREFAPGVGELLLSGSLSNIPKIWGGLQANGLAFYTRGSVDFTQPFPTLLDMSKAPPMQFLNDVAKGVYATTNNVLQGFSLQQQEEILANMSTNRALKSIMEMAADAKTSARGEVIEQGTRDAIHVAAALLGTQPSQTRAAIEAYSRQRNVQLAQEDLFATLTAHTRAVLRSGNFTLDDLQSQVDGYIRAGGNPARLGQWYRNTLMTATQPRTVKQLNALANSGKLLEFEDMLATLQQNRAPDDNVAPTSGEK